MITVNPHYSKLAASYLFVNIARKVEAFQKDNPGTKLIKLGIGDVTRPLPPACLQAFHEGVDELGQLESFRGYGPERGYAFLREAIAAGDYAPRGVTIDPEEIFVSDGAKCDTGNFQELFSRDIRVAVPDPVYPVYVDTNVMAGRTGQAEESRYEGLIYLEATEENGFIPAPPSAAPAAGSRAPEETPDLIYLCSPNNPTGSAATREQLQAWVDYARENDALILFDAAYEAFIRDDSLPRTIYECRGAREVAVEFRSFSKTAGFTGTRCAFTVVPKECRGFDESGKKVELHPLWNRRHSTKFNGVSYPVQKAAAAVYTPEGQEQVRELTDYYLENARIIRESLAGLGWQSWGGIHSPYIWVKTGGDSWEGFDRFLGEAGIVITPGSGFGRCGGGYLRISAFNNREAVQEAMERIRKAFR